MTDFYTPTQRRLQEEFDTRNLADLLIKAIVTDELTPQQIAFIHARNMFFLSTTDVDGFPSASYKGGAPGFVRVPSSRLSFLSFREMQMQPALELAQKLQSEWLQK